ncbi:helix-turn-helix transcriptional regulator [Giesbergeria anulus]|nr:AlpA family phage regulatory protein [Giesbergeria anulus]
MIAATYIGFGIGGESTALAFMGDYGTQNHRHQNTCRRTAPSIFEGVKNAITNGFPESGGGGVSTTESACTEATGTDAAPEASSDDDDGGDGDGDPDGWRPSPSLSPLRAPPCNAVTRTGAPPPDNPEFELWRLPTVLQRYPVSKRTWFAGVKSGIYPPPVKIATRAVAWRAADIRALVASL